MFERVMEWLEAAPQTGNKSFAESDIRTAVAGLFYAMVEVDGVIRDEEKSKLRALLQERYGLDGAKLKRLENEAGKARRGSPGIFPMTAILNRELDETERRSVHAQLVALAEADGQVHPLEQSLLDHSASMLQLD